MARDKKLKIRVETKGTKKATRQVRGLTTAFRGAGAAAASAFAPIIAIGAAYKAISGAIRVGAEFEQSMANLSAVTNANAKDFADLEAMAKELGRTTKFTAADVAGLGTEFGKLGFTAKQIQDVSKDTLLLAGAVGADLPRAAEVAGATLKGFGIDASDTQRVTNLMAASFSGSALDMEKFAESMKMVAPVAASAGFQIEGTTAMLGQLADVGIHGSMAGTSLKNIFLKLADSSSALSKEFGGPVKSVGELIPKLQELKAGGMGLSEALALTDKRSAAAFLTLVRGSDDLEELTKSFTGTDRAAEMYAIQQDTLKGRTDELISATQGLAIELFQSSEGGLKAIVEGMRDFMTATTNITLALKKVDWGQTFRNVVNDIPALIQVYIDIIKVYLDLIPDLFRSAFNKIFPIMKFVFGHVVSTIKSIASVMWEPIGITLTNAGNNIKKVFFDMIDKIKAGINILIKAANLLGAEITPLEMTNFIKPEALTMAGTAIGEFFAGVGEDNIKTAGDASSAIQAILKEYADKYIEVNEEMKDAVGTDDDGNVKLPGTLTQEEIDRQAEWMQQLADQQAASSEKTTKLTDDQKKALKEQGKAFIGNMQTIGKEFPVAEKAAKRFAQVQATVDAYASAVAAYKAMAGILGIGPVLGAAAAATALAAGMANVRAIERAATGYDDIVSKPTMFLAGEAGRERVSVTPLDGPNINGPQPSSVTVNISGNVMSEDYTESVIIPQIKESIRRGADIGAT